MRDKLRLDFADLRVDTFTVGKIGDETDLVTPTKSDLPTITCSPSNCGYESCDSAGHCCSMYPPCSVVEPAPTELC